jgi:hypothetical protein
MASQTSSPASMLPWALTPSPTRCPAAPAQRSPVKAAARPAASTMPTWRISGWGSTCCNASSTAGAGWSARSRSRPSGPYWRAANAWLQTTPTPASANVAMLPTLKKWDATPMPRAPLSRSLATIE